MKNLFRLIPITLTGTAVTLCSLSGALFHPHQGKEPVPVPFEPTKLHSLGVASSVTPAQKARAQASLAQMPMLFERNQGQFAKDVQFVSRGKGYQLALQRGGATLTLAPSAPAKHSVSRTLQVNFVGTQTKATVQGEHELATKINYMVGRDRKNWRTGVPTFDRVTQRGIYPGIDSLFYGNGRSLEYDFVVAPGAEPSTIRLRFNGADAMRLNTRGDLVFRVGREQVVQHAPVVYQNVQGRRVPVAGRYALRRGGEVGFVVGRYDRELPLVIDPTLAYSTYIGPDLITMDAFAIGGDGSPYFMGRVGSATFAGKAPTKIGNIPSSGYAAIFVAKFNPSGKAVDYVTYLGGTQAPDDEGNVALLAVYDMAVDAAGNVYGAGQTNLKDFPTARAFQSAPSPRVHERAGLYYPLQDAVLFKLGPTGGELLYSTYLGGSKTGPLPDGYEGRDTPSRPNNAQDGAVGVAVDNSGNAYITGATTAVDFPVVNGFQNHLAGDQIKNSPHSDAFVSRINTNLSGTGSLVYSTYLGGFGAPQGSTYPDPNDIGYKIVADETGKVYVVGVASKGTDVPFPIKGGLPPVTTEDSIKKAAFVAEIDTGQVGAASLVASTLIDGNGPNPYNNSYFIEPCGVALDRQGGVYIAGSNPFATIAGKTPTAVGGSATSGTNACVIKLNPSLSAVQYALVVGGSSSSERATAIQVDDQGQAYVAGVTYSQDFPLYKPLPHPTSTSGNTDDFLIKVSANGASLIYSTLIGGSGPEDSFSFSGSLSLPTISPGLALDGANNVYVAGNTSSSDFPVTAGAFQTTGRGYFLKIQGEGLYVNSTGDGDDADAATQQYDGSCSTGKTLSNGQSECTLRAAIQEANRRTNKPTINFSIEDGVPAGTIPKIVLKKPLPSLDVPMIVDGTTQPGTTRVWLNGVSGGNMSGLVVAGGDSLVKGLLINQVRGDGILVRTKGANKIENCWIGLNDKGIADAQTGVAGTGVHILNSASNTLGGATSDKRCVIGNNGGNGVWIDGALSQKNVVQSCYIGTDISGTQRAGNGKQGILVGLETVSASQKPLALNTQIGGAASVPGQAPGNVISANRYSGIALGAAAGTRIGGNLVGTDKSGTKALGNNIGILLLSASDNVVGDSTNVVSGNVGGIVLSNLATTRNRVEKNLVGTDISGTKALANGVGITVAGAKSNTIGAAGAPNVVSGNTNAGISLTASIKLGEQTASGVPLTNLVQYNYVGVDKSGTKALPNLIGVLLESADAGSYGNTVANNVVSGNSRVGVVVTRIASNRNASSTGNTINANLIGTDATGTKAIPNVLYGLLLQDAANHTVSGNTISGNGRAGLVIAGKYPAGYSPGLTEPGAYGPYNNAIYSNLIGTNKAGTSALSNGASAPKGTGAGILILPKCNSNPIGLPGKGNVISGNAGAGVAVIGEAGGSALMLKSNFIGTRLGGTTALANSGSGVFVSVGAIWIGGTAAGEGNTIGFNGGDGVTVVGSTGATAGNKILGNAIFSNNKLGIDLGANGVTPNRTPSANNPQLPNGGQNYPELVSAQVVGGKTNIQAILKSGSSTTYRIEFFLNSVRDPSGFGEGQKLVGAINVTTDGTGVAKFAPTLPVALSGTQFLSMTATDPKGNTSEFSGISQSVTGQVFTYITDPANAGRTVKRGLANVRVDRLDSRGAVKETTGTDADGFYVFVGVPTGTWVVKPSSKTGTLDTQFDPVSRSVTLSTNAPAATGVDFVTYSIYGTVKGVNGKPLANQVVSLVGLGRSVKTAANGTYRFDGLGKGSFNVEFGDSFSPKFSIVTLPTSGVAGASPNARVDAQQGLSISGFVEDATGKPLANVPVQLLGTSISPVVTDANGRYEFEGVVAGTYNVAPASSAGKFTPASRRVTLVDKNVDSVDFTKAPTTTRSISGGES